MKKIENSRKNEKGFTLVELAIVMIIIGLLIGGILKGQELITNAQVANAVSQAKGIDAGVSTFRDSYRALPGDMGSPGTRLPNCNAAPCNTANAAPDNRIAQAPNAAVGAGSEAQRFFVHLAAADLITGVQNVNNVIFGEGLPATAIGGGYTVGFIAGAALGTNNDARGGHYLSLREAATAPGGGTGPLAAQQAFRIDSKMDDGDPDTGSVFTHSAVNCQDGSGAYDEQDNPVGCALYIRIQG